jgi:hypothetical protein
MAPIDPRERQKVAQESAILGGSAKEINTERLQIKDRMKILLEQFSKNRKGIRQMSIFLF